MSEKDMVILENMRRSRYGEGIEDHDLAVIHQTETLFAPARLACVLIERWGLVAAESDGEDSAGRQKQRRLTAAELSTAACDAAAAAHAEFERRGWVLKVPLPTKRPAKKSEAETA